MPAKFDLVVRALHNEPQGDIFGGAQQVIAGGSLKETAAGDSDKPNPGLAFDPLRKNHQLRSVLSGHEATILGRDIGVAITEDALGGRYWRKQDNGHQQQADQSVDNQAAQGTLNRRF